MLLKHLSTIDIFSAENAIVQKISTPSIAFSNIIDKNAFSELKKEELVNILDSLPVSVMLINSNGQFEIINNKFTELTGYHYSEIPDESTWFMKMYPDQVYREEIFKKWQLAKNISHIHANQDILITCSDGTQKAVFFSTSKLPDGSCFVTMSDLSELKEANAKLQKSEESFWTMADVAIDPIYVLSTDGRFLKWNKSTQRLLRVTDLRNKYFYNFLSPEYKKDVIVFYANQVLNKTELTYKEFPILSKQGDEVWFGQNVVPKKDEAGNIEGFLIISRNITEQKKLQKKLEHVSVCDELTGLYNRRFFEGAFPQLVKSASRYQKSLAVVFIDLNDFKSANDNYGHEFGDDVLRAFAHLLQETGMRETDLICRYGGDEFVLVFGGLEPTDADFNIDRRVKEIMGKWQQEIVNNNIFNQARDLKFSLSVGIRLVDHQEIDNSLKESDGVNLFVRKVVKQADKAMYESKDFYRKFGISEINWHKLLFTAGKYAAVEKYLT